MSLSELYDILYATDLQREEMRDTPRHSWPTDRVEAIVAFPGQGEAVLDVGYGNGHLQYQLSRQFTDLYGLEYAEGRLRQARINLAGLPFHGVEGSAEAMASNPDCRFDCLVSADMIEHVPDVYLAATECFRVLRPGGWLVMNTPNIAFAKKRLQLLLGRFPSTAQRTEGLGGDVLFDDGHLHYFTFRSLGLPRRAGFELVKPVGHGSFGRLYHLWPRLLGGGVQWIASKPV